MVISQQQKKENLQTIIQNLGHVLINLLLICVLVNDFCSLINYQEKNLITYCFKCAQKISKQETNFWNISQSTVNPGPTPLCLENLTRIESQLICMFKPSIQIVVLPSGQLGEVGQAITFPSGVEHIVSELPHSDINVVLVEKEGSVSDSIDISNFARKEKIFEALEWLKKK